MSKLETKPKTLNLFSLVMINIAIFGSVNYWSFLAGYGSAAFVFFLVTLIVFFIPLVFVSSELVTTWTQSGGIYLWTKKAFGRHAGFIAGWILWVQSLIWIPLPLYWLGYSWSYAFFPKWVNNPYYHAILALLILWGSTLLIFRGMNTLKIMSIWCVIVGFFIPGLLVIGLGIAWFFQQPDPLSLFSLANFSQELSDPKSWAIFVVVIYSIVGVEMSSLHIQNVTNPKKTYPKALKIAAAIVALMMLFGALTISFALPSKEIHVFIATTNTLHKLLSIYNFEWLFPFFSFLIGIGIYAMIINWLAGPIKALLSIAKDGDLPPKLHRVNRNHMPTTIILIQAVVISFLVILLSLSPHFHQTYWVVISLITILYFLVYVLLFTATIKLRYKYPKVDRPYSIPGKKWGLWIICGIGVLASIATFCLGFILPSTKLGVTSLTYFLFLVFGALLLCLIPWFILLFKKPSWTVAKGKKEKKKTEI